MMRGHKYDKKCVLIARVFEAPKGNERAWNILMWDPLLPEPKWCHAHLHEDDGLMYSPPSADYGRSRLILSNIDIPSLISSE